MAATELDVGREAVNFSWLQCRLSRKLIRLWNGVCVCSRVVSAFTRTQKVESAGVSPVVSVY